MSLVANSRKLWKLRKRKEGVKGMQREIYLLLPSVRIVEVVRVWLAGMGYSSHGRENTHFVVATWMNTAWKYKHMLQVIFSSHPKAEHLWGKRPTEFSRHLSPLRGQQNSSLSPSPPAASSSPWTTSMGSLTQLFIPSDPRATAGFELSQPLAVPSCLP